MEQSLESLKDSLRRLQSSVHNQNMFSVSVNMKLQQMEMLFQKAYVDIEILQQSLSEIIADTSVGYESPPCGKITQPQSRKTQSKTRPFLHSTNPKKKYRFNTWQNVKHLLLIQALVDQEYKIL